MKTSSYSKWICEGYNFFSAKGPDGIIIENIAAKLGFSKSTFYHHFGDQDYFIELLLDEHIARAKRMSIEAQTLTSFIPDFPNLLCKYETEIFFHRQLRMHTEKTSYQKCASIAAAPVFQEIQNIWINFIGVGSNVETSKKLFSVIEDMFYQRLSTYNFTPEWMNTLSYELKAIVKNIATSPG